MHLYTDKHHNNAGGKRENHMKNQSSSQVAFSQAEVYTNKQKEHRFIHSNTKHVNKHDT